MSAISQLLLTRFGGHFKERFLEISTIDFNCHGDICPGNVSSGDICTKVNARSRQGQGKVKAKSRQGQGKVNASSRQG